MKDPAFRQHDARSFQCGGKAQKALAVYAANPSTEEGAKPYITAGARMVLQQVTDEELLKVLNVKGSETALFFEITEIKPLG